MSGENELTAVFMTWGSSKNRPAKGADFLLRKVSEYKDVGLKSDYGPYDHSNEILCFT